MGRPKRAAKGGYVYHVLNRANASLKTFKKPGDYEAFEEILAEAQEKFDMRILAYCLMPNHWHLVLWPRKDGQLSKFVGWLTLTHTQRWHAHFRSTGRGHLYQGRFKSFPVEQDSHFLTLCRYVERNALSAGLVRRAENWQYCSLWRWHFGTPEDKSLLSPWPVRRSQGWLDFVNEPLYEGEVQTIRRHIRRGSPYGGGTWSRRTVAALGLETTTRPRGRPRKGS